MCEFVNWDVRILPWFIFVFSSVTDVTTVDDGSP